MMNLAIIAVVALCLGVAASPIAATAAPHGKIETGVESATTVKQAVYNLTLTCDPPSVNVSQQFTASGYLSADDSGVSGAAINV